MSYISIAGFQPESSLMPEGVIEECCSSDSVWVPTLSFVFASPEGYVGMIRRHGGRWFLPKGTVNQDKLRSGQITPHEAIARTVFTKAKATFGGKVRVQEGTTRVLPPIMQLETVVEGVEKKWWPKAAGLLVLPTIALVDDVTKVGQVGQSINQELKMFGLNEAADVLQGQVDTDCALPWVYGASLEALKLAGSGVVELTQVHRSSQPI